MRRVGRRAVSLLAHRHVVNKEKKNWNSPLTALTSVRALL